VRAKYIRTNTGETKLVQIQEMSIPVFRIPGYEEDKPEKLDVFFDECEEATEKEISELKDKASELANRLRSLRRAKITAFDKILSNPDLDLFATFTMSPEAVGDRSSWDDCYKKLSKWLNNRVTRKGLKYIICPERHKAGGIHFHAILNSPAVVLKPAVNPHTNQPLTHNGKPLYNITDWLWGFTSAEFIQDESIDREKVAKYIFKYMGKQGLEGKIGGRYVLTGGNLERPFYLYGSDPKEFMPGEEIFFREAEHEGIKYREWNFI